MSKKRTSFAFVSNMIELSDIRTHVYPVLGRLLPLWVWERLLPLLIKYGFGSKCIAEYDVFGRVKGHTVLVLLTAEQMVSKRYLKLGKEGVLRACRYAQDRLGADVIGLGSLAKSVTSEGRYLKSKGIRAAVTHGDAYTAASGMKGVEKIEKNLGLQDPAIAVIGAYGKIGRAMTLLLAEKGYKIIAMGRDMSSVKKIQAEAGSGIEVTTDLKEALDKSDIAVMATSAPYSIINEDVLERGRAYCLYDLGQPYNLGPERLAELTGKGYRILRVDGGFEGSSRGIDIKNWLRLDRGVMYACFVETVTQALSGDRGSHVGPVDLEHVSVTDERATEWGFSHRPLTCFGRPVFENWSGERNELRVAEGLAE